MKRIGLYIVLIVIDCGLAAAQKYQVLWAFGGTSVGDGSEPVGNLISDKAGNLYGVTRLGGRSDNNCEVYGCGTAFELSPTSSGGWNETVLYEFCSVSGCPDGLQPLAGLVLDSSGNLYGTASEGGSCAYFGRPCGVVFELSPPQSGSGQWTEKILYNFCTVQSDFSCLDGGFPAGRLTFDSSGNLYGTTKQGGSGHADESEDGIAFKLTPGSAGWTESVLYNFCSSGSGNRCLDGSAPSAGVTFDTLGNLYGTTQQGGSGAELGTIYQLTPGQNGWTEKVLYSFTTFDNDAGHPSAEVTLAGNSLYTTFFGTFSNGIGGVIRLSSKRGGSSTLFNFNPGSAYGAGPLGGVLISGNAIYGTTQQGGLVNGIDNESGTIFSINASGQETVLYNFCSLSDCADGAGPDGGLIKDAFDNFYGTAEGGGLNNNGTVFEFTP